MPGAKNSYILMSTVSPVYNESLECVIPLIISDIRANHWWAISPLESHLSVGLCMGSRKDTALDIQNRNKNFAADVKSILIDNPVIKYSPMLLPEDIKISTNGWIILTFAEQQIQAAEQKDNLESLHLAFGNLAKNHKLILPAYSGANFKPHISLGKVKTLSADGKPTAMEIAAAEQALARDKQHILKQVAELRPLSLYDFHFHYNPPAGGKSMPLLASAGNTLDEGVMLPRRNFGILSVDAKTKPGNVIVHIDTEPHAKACANFLFAFGIKSQLGVKPKEVRNVGKDYTLLLQKQNEYDLMAGKIERLIPIK